MGILQLEGPSFASSTAPKIMRQKKLAREYSKDFIRRINLHEWSTITLRDASKSMYDSLFEPVSQE